jgi:putative transposase
MRQCGDPGQPECQDDGKRGARGYDKGKNINGRKRHILVDTGGLLIAAVVHAAGVQDRDGAKQLLAGLPAASSCQRLEVIWADGAYAGELITWVQNHCGWHLEIVQKPADQKGFAVLPRRWVVERTFAWLCRNRRLSKDYEENVQSSEAMIYLAMIHLMLRRLRPQSPR